MRNLNWLLVATLLSLFGSCQNMDPLNSLQAVKDGKLHFADGASTPIPHWGEAGWTHIFCVRHAEKAKDDPRDPNLTPEGQARAERLGRILAEAGLDSVYASPYRRTQFTAEPVQRRGKTPPVITYQPDKQKEWMEALLPNLAEKQVLIVGHQNTVPQLLNQLKGGGFDYDNIPDLEFGRFYVVAVKTFGDCMITEARY